MNIRPARQYEASTLTLLALESKAIWGYDEEFMRMCHEELTLTSGYIVTHFVYVIEHDQTIVGFYALNRYASPAVLEMFFISPAFQRCGYGRILWNHLCEQASQLGIKEFSIDADPNAEPFYVAIGAVRIGVTPSGSIPGRLLPLLHFVIPNDMVRATD